MPQKKEEMPKIKPPNIGSATNGLPIISRGIVFPAGTNL